MATTQRWPDDSQLLKIRDITGKGRGACATRDITPGEPILCEAPLVVSPLNTKADGASPWLVAAELATVIFAQQLASSTNSAVQRLLEHDAMLFGQPLAWARTRGS